MLDNIDLELKLKVLYLYTAITTIISGILVIAAPSLWSAMSDMPTQDKFIFGIVGSVWLAFGISSLLALRNPLKFVPVLLMQFLYKVVWTLGVFLPLVAMGQAPMYAILILIIFLTFIIPDVIVIPWSEILEKK